jgi:hypothetical protein
MLKITIETDDGTQVCDLTVDEQKAFEYVAKSPKEWIENAIRNRVRRAVDQIVAETTDKNPKKMSVPDKLAIVRTVDIKSAKERNDEFEAQVGG